MEIELQNKSLFSVRENEEIKEVSFETYLTVGVGFSFEVEKSSYRARREQEHKVKRKPPNIRARTQS